MITLKQFRAIPPEQWKKVYEYAGKINQFEVFACEACPGLTITHDKRRGFKRRVTTIIYSIHGRQTQSPSQAVKWWNENERRRSVADARDGAAKAKGK